MMSKHLTVVKGGLDMGMHLDVNDRGFALLAVLMLVSILSLLGMTSLQLATQEMTGTRALQEEHTAHHAAEAAVGMVMEWFHDPAAAVQGSEVRLLSKQLVDRVRSAGICECAWSFSV